MKTLSVTDLSIALAYKTGKLRYVERESRLGGTYVALEDDVSDRGSRYLGGRQAARFQRCGAG